MLTKDFYEIIDQELSDIIEKYPNDEMIKKYHNSINNQKSYALLIWFLKFYGKRTNYVSYITDGPGDNSCDIIFDTKDSRGSVIYYVIQSKWNIKKNISKDIGSTEIGYALSDFTTILRGNKKPTKNSKFNTKLFELLEHIKNNGLVKFIFLSLCQENINENVISFNQEFKPHELKFVDINRIKHDYIEQKYKQIKPSNPLEHTYKPEDIQIELEVTRRKTNGDFIKVDKPFDAYIFLVKPSIIFKLFEEFSFNLFFKNVRNPIINSTINQQMETTIIDNPAFFWYYNNGITAIVNSLPEISKLANKFKVYGFQIINGAQTVYAIYSAYKNASPIERERMDDEILITLRLLKSGGKDFDLQVTRYTNSQNPISDRDFHANDEVQIRLQQESFKTKFWYEKREGEFRGKIPENVEIIPNNICAEAYLAYELQDPTYLAYEERAYDDINFSTNLFFVSNKDHIDGLYEKIFNKNTKFEDILCSVYLFSLIERFVQKSEDEENGLYMRYNDIALLTYEFTSYLRFFKIIFSKYLKRKGINIPINREIIKLFEEEKLKILFKICGFIKLKLEKEIVSTSYNDDNTYENLKNYFEGLEINVKDIDNISMSECIAK